MIIPGLENEFPVEELEVFNHGRYDEIVQMLSDLGYLSISESEGEIVLDQELKDAVDLFRKEILDAGLIRDMDTLTSFPDDLLIQKFQILSYKEFYVLHELVSFDGDFSLKKLPSEGDLSVFSRVFHYRLDLLGLYTNQVGNPVDKETISSWNRLKSYLPQLEISDLLQLTGDINALIFAIKDCPTLNNRLVCFRYNADMAMSSRFNIGHTFSDGAFDDQYEKNISDESTELADFKTKVQRHNPDFNYLQGLNESTDNRFLVRFVQLYQWSSGYYFGKIDGLLGELSFNSFLELGRAEVESGNVEFQLQRLIGHVGQDYWVANVHYLLDQAKEPEKELDLRTVFNAFYNEYDRLSNEDQIQLGKNLDLAWKEANKSSRSHLRSKEFRFRRIYYGIKNMLRSFWKGIKGFVQILLKNTKDFIDTISNGIKSFAKFLFKEIREAIYMFAEGMSFLFGEREYTSNKWISKFDFDCDLVTISTVNADQKLGIEHVNLLRNKAHELDFSLMLTAKIIRFILFTQGIGWRRVILEAGVIFKQMIKERIWK